VDPLSSDLASLKIDRGAPAPSRSWAGPVTWIAIVAALAAGGRWAYPMLEAELFKTEVKTAAIVEVSPSLALTSLTATGYVVAERRSKVGSNMPGRIAKLLVKEGSAVKAGEVLVELDAADQRTNVAAAQARVMSAQAKVALARANLRETTVQLERQRALLAQAATTRSVVEDLGSRVTILEAEIAAAEAEVNTALAQRELSRVSLGRMTITAPLSGTVLTKPLDVGETVDVLTPILELADLSSLVVEIDVPEARLGLVKLGGPCEIALDAFPERRLRGKVRDLGKRVDRSKATVPVKVEFVAATEGVLPDMSARASFLTEAIDEKAANAAAKVFVPAQAVAQRDGRPVVFLVENGKVRMRRVTLGAATSDGIELLQGPSTGSRVVLDPPSTLAEGQRVKEGT